MTKIQDKTALIIALLIPLAVGTLSALLGGSMSIYDTLEKPPLAPPAVLFPIVWTLLYLLMGLSSYLVYQSSDPDRKAALQIYAVQLFFNFFWSILFFRFNLYLPAFLWLLVLIVLIAAMIRRYLSIEPLAACLQIPYLIWCLFAAYLNLAIVLIN